ADAPRVLTKESALAPRWRLIATEISARTLCEAAARRQHDCAVRDSRKPTSELALAARWRLIAEKMSSLVATWRQIAEETSASSTIGGAIVFAAKTTSSFAIIAGSGMTAPGGQITIAASSL